MKYKVNFGYNCKGHQKNKYFASLDAAKQAVSDYFKRTKIVLSIEASTDKSGKVRARQT